MQVVSNIGGYIINLLCFEDDMVLLAPSWHALQLLIDEVDLKFVYTFKYLGHIITNAPRDDKDIDRELRCLYNDAYSFISL